MCHFRCQSRGESRKGEAIIVTAAESFVLLLGDRGRIT